MNTLLLLTAEGGLYGMDLDSGRSQQLAQLELPAPTPPRPYWLHGFQLHCAPSGGYAVVADNGGSFCLLVNLGTGQVVAQLHGGDYHPHTVPFSIAFTQHQGRDVLIHRTDWNRLDAMDCATGANPHSAGRHAIRAAPLPGLFPRWLAAQSLG